MIDPIDKTKLTNNHGTFLGYGNTELYYQSWLPDTAMHAVVVIVHGGGDHSGRFGNVVKALVPEGFGIYMFDLRGHGRSPGKRGHIQSWEVYRNDLSAFLDLVRSMQPELPLFLFGHSMGAVIVLDLCIRLKPDNITGVVCTSPAIGKLGIPAIMFTLARLLEKVWPSLVLPNGLVVPHLSRDDGFIRKTKADPLYHTLSTPRFGMEMIKTVEFIQDHASSVTFPLYLIHGKDDKIASIEGSSRFVKNAVNASLTYKEYDGGYHELFNDLDKEKVLADLVAWLTNMANPDHPGPA